MLYFTGEAIEDDDDEYDEEGEEADEEGEEEGDEETIQTMTQRRIKIQQRVSSSEAGCMWP